MTDERFDDADSSATPNRRERRARERRVGTRDRASGGAAQAPEKSADDLAAEALALVGEDRDVADGALAVQNGAVQNEAAATGDAGTGASAGEGQDTSGRVDVVDAPPLSAAALVHDDDTAVFLGGSGPGSWLGDSRSGSLDVAEDVVFADNVLDEAAPRESLDDGVVAGEVARDEVADGEFADEGADLERASVVVRQADRVAAAPVAAGNVSASTPVSLPIALSHQAATRATRSRGVTTRAAVPAALAHRRRRRTVWLSSTMGVAALALTASVWLTSLPLGADITTPAGGGTIETTDPADAATEPASGGASTAQTGGPGMPTPVPAPADGGEAPAPVSDADASTGGQSSDGQSTGGQEQPIVPVDDGAGAPTAPAPVPGQSDDPGAPTESQVPGESTTPTDTGQPTTTPTPTAPTTTTPSSTCDVAGGPPTPSGPVGDNECP